MRKFETIIIVIFIIGEIPEYERLTMKISDFRRINSLFITSAKYRWGIGTERSSIGRWILITDYIITTSLSNVIKCSLFSLLLIYFIV